MRGRINSASALVLRKYKEREGNTDPVRQISALRHVFWTETIDITTQLILDHVQAARQSRNDSKILAGSKFMEPELDRIAHAVERAKKERNATLEFITSYTSPMPNIPT